MQWLKVLRQTYTKLPNPLEDDIVCNNISYSEFDYIEGDMLDDDDI